MGKLANTYFCIDKNDVSGECKLQDFKGNVFYKQKEDIKTYLLKGTVNILNLSISKDGKLIMRLFNGNNPYKIIGSSGNKINVVECSTGKVKGFTIANLIKFSKSVGVDGIELDAYDNIVSFGFVDISKYSVNKINYNFVKFLNRVLLEMQDIPEEVYEMSVCLSRKKKYVPVGVQGSYADYAESLYKYYKEYVGDSVSPNELSLALNNPKSTYGAIYALMQSYSFSTMTPDSCNELLRLLGLPLWTLAVLRKDLYCISWN